MINILYIKFSIIPPNDNQKISVSKIMKIRIAVCLFKQYVLKLIEFSFLFKVFRKLQFNTMEDKIHLSQKLRRTQHRVPPI